MHSFSFSWWGTTTSFHQDEVQLEMTRLKQEPNDPFRGTFWVNKGAEIRWRIALDEMLVVPLSFSVLNDSSSPSWLTATRQHVLMPTDCMEIHPPLTAPGSQASHTFIYHPLSPQSSFQISRPQRPEQGVFLSEFQLPFITKKTMKAPVSPVFVEIICGADVS